MKAYHTSTGSSVETVWAQDDNGGWWTRSRVYNYRFGWRWSAWRESAPAPAPGEIDLDFGGVSAGSAAIEPARWPAVRLPRVS
jgi:hypothetical protein